MARIDITEFERLIHNSKLSTEDKSSIIKDITNLINKNKGVGFGFINNEDFLKTVDVILNDKQQDSEVHTQLARYLRFINNNKHYWSFIVEDMAKDENKDAIFNLLKDEDLFRATEIISNSSIQYYVLKIIMSNKKNLALYYMHYYLVMMLLVPIQNKQYLMNYALKDQAIRKVM
ncbi:hypothetical protein [Wolbachia endosymbiont of Folsomia candida]|uniref:hypothetical protein n=1 Tax=Wolbachia endosymbiont of Folsomia candida TaxID=169402 RepID=UPI000A873181|nr:hypothetical protein [Wolbachia endosymbiont of Folsomia candida]APR98924.1 hypothetical protein ASM33_06970 [Wolbachia endosymbiont of Folsomia candida]